MELLQKSQADQLLCVDFLSSSRDRLSDMMRLGQFCDAVLATSLHSIKVCCCCVLNMESHCLCLSFKCVVICSDVMERYDSFLDDLCQQFYVVICTEDCNHIIISDMVRILRGLYAVT